MKGLVTRRRILDCAVARFADEGFRQTLVAQVARDAGLTAPAVHAHFGSKEALFQAAFDEDVANLLAVLNHRLASGALAGGTANPADLIPQLLSAIEDHPLVRRVFRGLEPDRTADLRNAPAVLATREQLVATIRAGQAAGLVRTDLDAVALGGALETIVLALLLGAVQFGAVHIGMIGDEGRRSALHEIVLRGMLQPLESG